MQSSKYKVAILRNEIENDHSRWVSACNKFNEQVAYEVINLTKNNWLKDIQKFKPDLLLTKPGGLTSVFKQLYDERLMILTNELGYKCFPSLSEVLIYENKRYFSFWLKANRIPHPSTNVFYFKDEAIKFATNCAYPLVAKVNIGASGSGVQVLHDQKEAIKYIMSTFSGKGAAKRSGPNLQKGGLIRRGFNYVLNPSKIAGKLSVYKARAADVQNNFVLMQEFINHDYEWRVVRIGESFFAHKKMKMSGKASGSLLKNYDNPPLTIFDFVKELTDRFGFYCQSVDIFESDRGYLVNEMQCIFGQSDPYQMLVDGQPGCYIHQNNQWVFQEGDFNTNESYDLRLQVAIKFCNS